MHIYNSLVILSRTYFFLKLQTSHLEAMFLKHKKDKFFALFLFSKLIFYKDGYTIFLYLLVTYPCLNYLFLLICKVLFAKFQYFLPSTLTFVLKLWIISRVWEMLAANLHQVLHHSRDLPLQLPVFRKYLTFLETEREVK